MVLVQLTNNLNFTMKLTEKQIKRYSRQMVLKKIGPIGQKKLLNSKDFNEIFHEAKSNGIPKNIIPFNPVSIAIGYRYSKAE